MEEGLNDTSLAKLQATVDSYRTLMSASNIGTWLYHISTGRLSCNDVYFSMLGIEASEEDREGKYDLQTGWLDLLHQEDRSEAENKFRNFITGPPDSTYESFFRLIHPSKGWIWVWARSKLIKGQDGNLKEAIGSHIDITAQKTAEENMLKERILLRTLIDYLPDTIYVKDSRAQKVIANVADVRSIGARSEAEVLGKTDRELYKFGESGERGYQDDLAVLRTGNPIFNKEESFTDGNGHVNWLLTSKIPVRDETGETVRLIGIGHNITQRKIDEEALNKLNAELQQQAIDLKALNEQLRAQKEQEMEKALAQGKFEIASEVLHDVGNALVGFGSYLGRINKTLDQNNCAPARSLSSFLTTQADKLTAAFGAGKSAALIDLSRGLVDAQERNNNELTAATRELLHIVSHIKEILNIQRQFVKGQEGKHERKLVNMQDIIEDCRSMIQSALSKRGIDFQTSISPGRYLFKGDVTKMMQVLLNLLKNAMEAMSPGQAEKLIALTMNRNAGSIVLRMTDSGTGFDQETGQHLFERGFTTKQSGTGLGLYNCRSIIESHNGSLEITSDGNMLGSSVTIELPAS